VLDCEADALDALDDGRRANWRRNHVSSEMTDSNDHMIEQRLILTKLLKKPSRPRTLRNPGVDMRDRSQQRTNAVTRIEKRQNEKTESKQRKSDEKIKQIS
jgi:hypothetical protein